MSLLELRLFLVETIQIVLLQEVRISKKNTSGVNCFSLYQVRLKFRDYHKRNLEIPYFQKATNRVFCHEDKFLNCILSNHRNSTLVVVAAYSLHAGLWLVKGKKIWRKYCLTC